MLYFMLTTYVAQLRTVFIFDDDNGDDNDDADDDDEEMTVFSFLLLIGDLRGSSRISFSLRMWFLCLLLLLMMG